MGALEMSRSFSSRRVHAIGVTLPIHNEEQRLGRALDSLTHSFAELDDSGVSLRVTLVLDACRDGSGDIARAWKHKVERHFDLGVSVLECEFENVGSARAVGCENLLRAFRGLPHSGVWLATTDADSQVPRRWLTAQLDQHEAGADAWVGRVAVSDWAYHRRETALTWQHEYESERWPIHGANLGIVAERYLAVGGFRSLRTGEDRAIVKALLNEGASVHFDAMTRVTTSSRRRARAPDGFGAALRRIEAAIPHTTRYRAPGRAFDERAVG
jgi:hypothetical protein